MSKKLVDYVRSQLQNGHDISSIRQISLKYGYSSKDIDDAIKEVYNPTIRHEIHLGKTTVFMIILILAVIGIGAFYFLAPKSTTGKLLDVNLEPVLMSAKPGESISFIKDIKNLGSSNRYDVEITQEIIDQKTFQVIMEKTETVAVETSASIQTRMTIPQNTKPGDYILRAIAQYDGKKAIATLSVKIVPSLGIIKETCFDNIKNQNEEDIDCGGLCPACLDKEPTEEEIDCNDANSCTQDINENGRCTHSAIKPCCGNGLCENDEACSLDCESSSEEEEMPSIEELKALAITDPARTQQYCERFEVPDLKDTCLSNLGEAQSNKNYCNLVANSRLKDVCYMNLAKKLKDNSICNEITTEGRKDSCYMGFVTDYKDYSVCPRITNSALKQSCEYLKQIYSINQNTQPVVTEDNSQITE